jgi:two-component system sensor histidine kinase VanS
LDKSRDSKTGGSGLGLAIAKEIIELHHGSIEVISENEKIEFIVSLPMPL